MILIGPADDLEQYFSYWLVKAGTDYRSGSGRAVETYHRAKLFLEKRILEHIRSSNGRDFTARGIREWLGDLRVETFMLSLGIRGRTATLTRSIGS